MVLGRLWAAVCRYKRRIEGWVVEPEEDRSLATCNIGEGVVGRWLWGFRVCGLGWGGGDGEGGRVSVFALARSLCHAGGRWTTLRVTAPPPPTHTHTYTTSCNGLLRQGQLECKGSTLITVPASECQPVGWAAVCEGNNLAPFQPRTVDLAGAVLSCPPPPPFPPQL
jgi:hypothetical protein